MPDDPKLSEIVAEGYAHLQGFCPKCHMWRTMGLDRLTVTPGKIDPEKITLSQLSARLRCKECGTAMERVEPWRQSDQTGDTVPSFGAQRRRPRK